MKTKFKGCDPSPLSWNEGGRPSSKDIVKHHKAANIKSLGYTNFTSERASKVGIKGKGQKGI